MGRATTLSDNYLSIIQDMLDSGCPKAEIAQTLSVSSDSITQICKKHSLVRHMKCILCGDIFESEKSNRTICSKNHYRECVICGKHFLVSYNNLNVTTCSPKCTGAKKAADGTSKSASAKARAAWISNWGVDNPAKSEKIQSKFRDTMRRRYGVDYAMQNSNLAEKNVASRNSRSEEEKQDTLNRQRATMKTRYGGYPWESKSTLNAKMRSTMLELYDVENILLSKSIRIDHISKVQQLLADEITRYYNREIDQEFPLVSRTYDIKLDNVLVELDPTITHNSHRSIFTQNNKPLSATYHKEKSELAAKHGYRCIHIFDWDDWNKMIPIIAPKQSIYARKCRIASIDQYTANVFTERYHIQGKCRGQVINYGLYHNNELVEIMTFGKPRYNRHYDLELLRLCTKSDIRVAGGASRLFKHFLQENPGKSVISYCDLAKFTGKVYEEIGMTLNNVTPPAKIWSKDDKYITDNLLRQRGYDQLFNANYGKGTSNEELMLNDGWLPVYDCGQAVYEWRI